MSAYKIFTAKNTASGFTLLEVMASLVIMSLMISTVLLAYQRTNESIIRYNMHQRAATVAQRQMEYLIASGEEPNSVDTQGTDEIDPIFDWAMNLTRVSVDSSPPRPDLTNTVIKAVVTVEWQGGDFGQDENNIEMIRYFSVLKPLPGNSVAVPLIAETQEEQWYIDLRERLGREPTADEALRELVRIGDLPPELAEFLQMGMTSEDDSQTDEDSIDEDALKALESLVPD